MLDTRAVARLAGAEVATTSPVSGGDVAQSFRVELTNGSVVFAKTHADPPAHFFSTEAWGIGWLDESATVRVPSVLGVSDDPPMLVLEWVDESAQHATDDEEFGSSLAALHQTGAPCFGREDGRTTGSRGLPNTPCATWAEFFATQRLLPLCRMATDTEALDHALVGGVERIADRLVELGGPVEPPARLHGDLWAGNRIVDGDGRSWLIDPACHGGHREFDLAMMRLFGGFSSAVFIAYDDANPVADGWRERVQLHQLAPLIVHAIKFGGSYVPAVRSAVALLT